MSESFDLKHGLFDDLQHEYPMVGRKTEWAAIENFINKESHGCRSFLIIGDYGSGKTFMLGKIRREFKNKTFKQAEKSLVVTMRLVEGEPETKLARSITIRVFESIGYSRIHNIANRTRILDERQLDANFQKIIRGIQDKKRIAYDWLCGHSLSTKDKNILGVSNNLATNKDATRTFYNFLKFLKSVEIENVYLLIEEFEYVVTVYNQKQVDAILYFFKDIYDKYGESPNTMAKITFIIATTPAGWGFLNNLEERRTGGGGVVPWIQRMNPRVNNVELVSLSEDETEQLLLQRIRQNRIEHADSLPDESWPFTRPEFFKLIYEKGKGIPRKCLKYCDYVFDCGIRDNIAEFDGSYTQAILEKI